MITAQNMASEGINDPNFLPVLGVEILLFICTAAIGGWLIYFLLGKYAPRLNTTYRIGSAILITFVLVCIAGFASQQLGL